MIKIPVDYSAFELVDLSPEDLMTIELKAKSLSLDDTLLYMLIDKSLLQAESLAFATRIHKRGRLAAIDEACQFLFAAMKGKTGHAAALDYLKQMSNDFTADSLTSTTAGVSFRINT